MKIISIISVHKPPYNKQWPLERGYKRVEAIVEENGWRTTRHLDIKKDVEEPKKIEELKEEILEVL